MKKQYSVQLETIHGAVELLIEESGENVQVNCVMPPHGPGFFVVFPEGQTDKAIEAAVVLANTAALPERENITALVDGALVAGTVPRPSFQFGKPEVKHDEL